MSDRLPRILDVARQDDEVRLSLEIPADLYWFRGHFPGFPILPGVVQLDWAIAFARQYLDLPLRSGRRFQVKFNAVIGPGDRLSLKLAHLAAKGQLQFEYAQEDGRACSSGRVTVTP